jgi:hypothetical protein
LGSTAAQRDRATSDPVASNSAANATNKAILWQVANMLPLCAP